MNDTMIVIKEALLWKVAQLLPSTMWDKKKYLNGEKLVGNHYFLVATLLFHGMKNGLFFKRNNIFFHNSLFTGNEILLQKTGRFKVPFAV